MALDAASGAPLTAVTGVGGNAPKAFIMHHTGGRGTLQGVLDTLRKRGLGVQYIMDRDGMIHQVGGPGEHNIMAGWGPQGAGLSNQNIVGMEVIANDDSDITPAQVASAQQFIRTYYPNTPVYGHGQVNPGHKQATEGMTIVNAINADRKQQGGVWNPQQQAQQMAQQGYSPEQIKAAFLTSIASGESPGYDVMYGGRKFTDYSRHPHQQQPIFDPNHPGQVIGHADVAGRYQFKGSTWDELAKKYGYKDFTPATQDAAAWQYAQDIFKTKTGGSLEEALASGDPGRINAAAQVLNQTWTSLPGGKEQAKGYGSQTFADIYNKSLNAAGGTGVHPPTATVGTPGSGTTEPLPPLPGYGQQRQKTAGEVFGEGIAKMGAQPEPASSLPGLARPQVTMSSLAPMATVDPGQTEARRQMLAMAMARLNSGGLWG
jgi:muramidase (phage lysozyme)